MLAALRDLYRESWLYALACPLPFLVPVAAEAMQHVAELATGFYAGVAQAHAVAASPIRMGLGMAKLLAVLLTGYWMVRWLGWGEAARVLRRDPEAERRFAPLLALEALTQLAGLWLIYGVHARLGAALVAVAVVIPFLLSPLLADWQARAPLGQAGGPLVSAGLVMPVLPWAIAFSLLACLPVMVVHYALGYCAIAGPNAAKWLSVTADTLLVGYLSAVLAGVPWFIARHARAQAARRQSPAGRLST